MKTGADFIFVGSGAVELATRKANGIVQFWEGWVQGEGRCYNPSDSRPNFLGDSTSLLTSWGGKGVGDLLHFAKLAKRSFKGKGDGARRGLVWRFLEVCDALHCKKKSGTVPYPIFLNR